MDSGKARRRKLTHVNEAAVCPCGPYIQYILDAVTSSGILKAKQKIGVTFNFDKQDILQNLQK